jgi:hypothetical protein
MDGMTIGIIVLVVAAIAFYIYRRSRPAPHGTYDDPKVRSSGSIGGGTRAYDDKDVRSSGSIGGGPRAYDTPEHHSEGSIGEQSTATTRRTTRTNGNLDEQEETEELEEPRYDNRNVKSGGSFGSS